MAGRPGLLRALADDLWVVPPLDDLDTASDQLIVGFASRERLAGWMDALSVAGLEPLMVRQLDDSIEHTDEAARLLLDRDDPPTAVLCFSDVLAFGFIRTANDLGMRVPEDLSMVGFDDHPLAGTFRPTLTTVRQDVLKKGRVAAEALTAALRRSPSAGEAPHVLLPTELVVRDSVAPPPTQSSASI